MRRVRADDIELVRAFLIEADLTVAGIESPAVHLWLDQDDAGAIMSTTGYEVAGTHALVRSVAVRPDLRGTGVGLRNAAMAIVEAQLAGATTAWLFSRRSGAFWQKLGFERATIDELVAALPDAAQVQLFAQTGQLTHEVAWRRELTEREL